MPKKPFLKIFKYVLFLFSWGEKENQKILDYCNMCDELAISECGTTHFVVAVHVIFVEF